MSILGLIDKNVLEIYEQYRFGEGLIAMVDIKSDEKCSSLYLFK